MKELLVDRITSEIGTILLVVDANQVCALDYEGYEERMLRLLRNHYGEVVLHQADNPGGFSQLIHNYFSGELECLNTIPVNPGGTLFQQEVWACLRTIPTGTVATYGELALKLGKAGAARAVGLANSLNPVAIIVPCHRVIGANAHLTGYAGGLERKRWLLLHEGVRLEGQSSSHQMRFGDF